ncbi:MAG: carbohydrate porin [Syntrophobacteraceae bacterium]
MGYKTSAQKSTGTAVLTLSVGRCLVSCLLLLLFSIGMAVAEPVEPKDLPGGTIIANPMAAYTFAGLDQLGLLMGLSPDSALRLGGYFISEFTYVASGGTEPGSDFHNVALGLHATLDTNKAFRLPGGTLGIEFVELAGASANLASGTVQGVTHMDWPPPHDRQEMHQLWWRQSLFDNRLIFQIGRMNGSGIFGNLQIPVIIDDPRGQEGDITNLLFIPVGLNPTLFSKLPAYPETGYGAVVHVAPTKSFYLSYGIFDANGMVGVQTGLESLPKINSYKLHIGEVGYSWRVGEERKPGRFGIGGWRQTGEVQAPGNSFFDKNFEDGANGFYLFGHQRLWYLRPDRDNAGIIGWFNLGHTDANTRAVKTYFGAGLTGLRLVPGRPADQISIGTAWSWLNDSPIAGEWFYPGTKSQSTALGESEFMLQTVYQTTFFFKMSRGFWSISPVFGYTFIPNPGQHPDLPAAHVLSLRLVTLF